MRLFASSQLPKGKHQDHVRCVATGTHGGQQVTASYVAVLRVRNGRGYAGWGAVLTTGRDGTDQMFLFPDAVASLALALPAAAAAAPPAGGVVLQHTVRGLWQPWRVLTRQSAIDVGTRLGQLPPTT